MKGKSLSRRDFLRMFGGLAASTLAAGCAPKTVIVEKEVEKVVTQIVKETVKETVIVEGTPKVLEKEVTKVVQQEVVVTATPLPPEPIELRVHTRAGVDLDEYFLTVLDDFYARVPDVTVKLEVIPGGALEYASKMLVLAAGGQVGDAVWSASRAGFNRRFMGIGLLKPLDEFVNAEGFDVGQYYDYCIDEATYDGQLMALPHISEPGNVGLSMNLDLFEAAGVDPITFDSSMDDLIATAQAIKDTTGKFGFGLGPQIGYLTGATDYYKGSTRVGNQFTLEKGVTGLHNRWDAGATVFLDYIFKPEKKMKSLRLGLKYYIGLTDIIKDNTGDSVSNSTFLLSLGIPVGGSGEEETDE